MALARIAGVSSVNGMTGAVTIATGSTPDVAVILASDHGTLDPTGAADQAVILRACYTAALAALASGSKSTEIVWPAGTFKMSTAASGGTAADSAGGSAIALRSITGGHSGQIRLRGQGVGATSFKMTTACAGMLSNRTGDTGTFGNLVLERFTVDHNNINVSGRPCVLLNLFGDFNVDQVTVQDVNIVNMHAPNGSTVVTGIGIGPTNPTWNNSTQYTATNIFVRRCRFLGGNYGLSFQSYAYYAGTAVARDADILAGGTVSNNYFDNVIIENFYWDSQVANFATAPELADSAGIMIGSAGVFGKLRITDCTVKGSYDVGYEIDSAYDAILTRCVAEDCRYEGFYFRHQGGLPDFDAPSGAVGPAYDRTNFSLIDCTYRSNKLASTTQGLTPDPATGRTRGFALDAFDYGIPSGNVVIRNFQHIVDGPRALHSGGGGSVVSGGFRSVDIDGLRVSNLNFNHDQAFAVGADGLYVGMLTGRGTFRLRNLQFVVEGSNAGTTQMVFTPLTISALSDYTVDIDGVYSRINVTHPGGGSAKVNEVVLGQNFADAEAFANATIFAMGWRNDLTGSGQSLNDFTVTSGSLNVASPGSKEYRLTQIKNQSNFAYGAGAVGPVTDQNVTVKCTKPTTPTSAYKHGVRLKINPKTGADSLHCYVDYTGTNYRLRIDTEVAGVLTNRASTTIGATVTSPFYVRGKIVENVVTAEYLTSAPSAVAPAATASTTYTLNWADGEILYVGPQATQGYPGLVWKPVDSGSTSTNVTSYFMSVWGGRIARVSPVSEIGAFQTHALDLADPAASNQLRLKGTVELPEWNLSGFATYGLTPIAITDPLITKKLRASRWTYQSSSTAGTGTPPAGAAITVGASPYTYTNNDYYDEDVAIYGGTVSAISVTRVGGSASQVSDSTGRVLRLAPGEAVTVTYSVAPTMRATPVT